LLHCTVKSPINLPAGVNKHPINPPAGLAAQALIFCELPHQEVGIQKGKACILKEEKGIQKT